MKSLVSHIEKLLLSNDCVVIPDFGGFVAHHEEAYYDEQEHLFIPPRRTIGFNAQLKMNDSLLAQSFAESNDISYPEACSLVENKVEHLQLILENEGSFDFWGIGTISINHEGNKEFTPFESGILTPGLYGLGFVDLQPLSIMASTGQETSSAKVVPLNKKKSSDTVSIKKSTLRTVAAACVALLLFFALPSSVKNSTTKTSNADISSMLKLLPRSISDNTITTEQAVTDIQSNLNEITPLQSSVSEEAPEDNSENYSIVLASHISMKNATQFVEHMQQKGFNRIQILSGKFIKVVYGSFESADDAYEHLGQLRSVEEFKEAWVLKMNE